MNRILPVLTVVLVIVALWYVAAVGMNRAWVYDQASRAGVEPPGFGGLITATLRILFSDLFVHGTGGGRYDVFTSQFIRAWWNVEPTPFAVASASRYLFDQERQQLSRLQEISDNIRDYQFNPQRHLGSGVFSTNTETTVSAALAEKESAVKELQSARASGLPADEIGRRIQRLGDLIKTTVTAEFSTHLTQLQALSADTITAVNSRTWPWFFFA